jgi:hypothetical protein
VTDDSRLLLQLDGRRRITLGALAEYTYYLAQVTLTPAVVVPVNAAS